MNNRSSRYSFFINPVTLFILLLVSWISAGFVPHIKAEDNWIPALTSFTDISNLGERWSMYISTLLLICNAISIYAIGLKSMATGKNKFLLPLIYLLFVLISPSALYFSGSSVSSLLILWSLYFSNKSKQSDLHFFISGFLSALAILFEPTLALLVILIMFFAFSTRGVTARSVVMMSASVLIPFIFVLSVRYILYDDAVLFSDLFIDAVTAAYPLQFALQNFSDLVLYLALFITLLSAVWYIAEQRGRYKIEKAKIMTRFILMLLIVLAIILLYPINMTYYASVISIPVAVIMNEYLINYEKSNKHKIQWIILLTLMLVARISEIIL